MDFFIGLPLNHFNLPWLQFLEWTFSMDVFVRLFVGLFCWTFCWTYMLDLYVGLICWTYLLDLFVGLICWTFLLDSFVYFIANVWVTDSHAMLLEMLSHLKISLLWGGGTLYCTVLYYIKLYSTLSKSVGKTFIFTRSQSWQAVLCTQEVYGKKEDIFEMRRIKAFIKYTEKHFL